MHVKKKLQHIMLKLGEIQVAHVYIHRKTVQSANTDYGSCCFCSKFPRTVIYSIKKAFTPGEVKYILQRDTEPNVPTVSTAQETSRSSQQATQIQQHHTQQHPKHQMPNSDHMYTSEHLFQKHSQHQQTQSYGDSVSRNNQDEDQSACAGSHKHYFTENSLQSK